jgi:hypothetical protein
MKKTLYQCALAVLAGVFVALMFTPAAGDAAYRAQGAARVRQTIEVGVHAHAARRSPTSSSSTETYEGSRRSDLPIARVRRSSAASAALSELERCVAPCAPDHLVGVHERPRSRLRARAHARDGAQRAHHDRGGEPRARGDGGRRRRARRRARGERLAAAGGERRDRERRGALEAPHRRGLRPRRSPRPAPRALGARQPEEALRRGRRARDRAAAVDALLAAPADRARRSPGTSSSSPRARRRRSRRCRASSRCRG